MDLTKTATQTCRTCGETKPLEDFDIRADTGERKTQCKECRRAYQKERYRASAAPSLRCKRLIGMAEIFICTRCGQMKPADDFPKRGPHGLRLQSWCRACFSTYKADRHRRDHEREMRRIRRNKAQLVAANRARVLAYLSTHPCVDCGEAERIVLDFDHVRGEKRGDVSRLVASGVRWERIQAEIEKCDVRCANDHRRATHQRRRDRGTIAETVGRWRPRPRRDSNARPTPSKGAALVH